MSDDDDDDDEHDEEYFIFMAVNILPYPWPSTILLEISFCKYYDSN
jgi:hypothetical protein